MPVPYNDMAKEKQQQAVQLCLEARGEYLDLGKKISIPQDLMMEELNLLSNRGSRMFQERQKRVERFTLEGFGSRPEILHQEDGIVSKQATDGQTNSPHSIKGVTQPGRTNLLATLQNTVAKKGNPGVLAPGYSGPLKEIPPEKFNVTVIPKSYSSPWEESGNNTALLAVISAHLPEPPCKQSPANYKCFNRAPIPFGGTSGSMRTLSLPGFELQQAYTEPSLTWKRMCNRPNFNRMPKGWGAQHTAESVNL